MNGLQFIVPEWPAPQGVRSLVTTRVGGVGLPPFESLNLGDHVGDDPQAVAENRRRLRMAAELPEEPRWLAQVHGRRAVLADEVTTPVQADASYTSTPGIVCAVLTADCLPVLLCSRNGDRVGAVHAGWRGLAGGVIDEAVQALAVPGEELMVWLGPAIGPESFEVGEEVRALFVAEDVAAAAAFLPSPGGRWLADIYHLARLRLARLGVEATFGGGHCTFSEQERFFSYRRDGVTGRIASLIWIEPQP